MNEIRNNFLLVGDKTMPQTHQKPAGFTYSACGPFTKKWKISKNSRKQEIQNIFIKTN